VSDSSLTCPPFHALMSWYGAQALFSLGFVLAVVYHICHMNVDGLQSSTILGISGPLWRTFDIICAQWLLARTFGHAVGASHWVTQGRLPLFLHNQFSKACVHSSHILSLQDYAAQYRHAAGRHRGWLNAH